MTGPEHYQEAERLVELASSADDHILALKAQVHATLALAAATALCQTVKPVGTELKAWKRAASATEGGVQA